MEDILDLSLFDEDADILDWLPRRVVTVSPEAYLNMSPERRAEVRSVRFVPPKIGGQDFGRFELTLKTPELFGHVPG